MGTTIGDVTTSPHATGVEARLSPRAVQYVQQVTRRRRWAALAVGILAFIALWLPEPYSIILLAPALMYVGVAVAHHLTCPQKNLESWLTGFERGQKTRPPRRIENL